MLKGNKSEQWFFLNGKGMQGTFTNGYYLMLDKWNGIIDPLEIRPLHIPNRIVFSGQGC